MKRITTYMLALIACTVPCLAAEYPEGLPGLFSINAHGGQVRFAQGNLQYNVAVGQTTHPDGTISAGT